MAASHFFQIQSLEQTMSKALAMVRRHLNSHNPMIFRIPPEILIMIASHLKTDATLIVKVTHVCHHWRATFLSCPDLWTYPDFERWVEASTFFDRARPLPMHVDLKYTYHHKHLVNFLCQHDTRVRTLKISHFEGLQDLFLQPLASLKTLEVTTQGNWVFADDTHPLARDFPVLKTFIVRHVPGALAFRGALITHLHVTISSSTLYQELGHLPDLLRSCALLEDFGIESKEWLEESGQLRFDEVIPLPQLRSFAQTLHLKQHMAGILDSLDLPPSCSVVLRCIAGETNGCPSSALPDLRDTSYLTNLKRLKISLTQSWMEYEANHTLIFINDKGTQFTAGTVFRVFCGSPPTATIENPNDAKIEPSIPGIEVLCIDSTRHVPLEGFSSLTTLALSRISGYSQLKSLAELGDPHAHRNLHTLVLYAEQDEWFPDPVMDLLTIAKSRAQAGLPLRVVTVASSELTPGNLDILEEMRTYVGRLELLLGDDVLDWDLDKYFFG